MLNLKQILFSITGAIAALFVFGQETTVLKEGAQKCLKCHGQQTYYVNNTWTGKTEKKLMNPYFMIDSAKLAMGVHGSFNCTDCHATEYETYPHSGELKLMPMANCLDCHGGDTTYAKYQFERIEEEFQKSVHYRTSGESFTCSKCHNQHYYKSTARNSSDIKEIVAYNNNMCLACHNDIIRFHLITDAEKPVLDQVHEWLPNQELHFRNIRCIECHTQVTDTMMVSHNILPGENARKQCSECHTANSILKASLYKYENIKARQASNLITTFRQEQPYIIGASQTPVFKKLTISILVFTLLCILIHIIFRIFQKKKYQYPPGKRIYFYPLWLRAWHMINGAGIIVLIFTGIIMHWGIHHLFIDFNFAITLHNITGVVVTISYFFFFIGNIIYYNSRYYRVNLRGWQTKIFKQAQYYLQGMFKGEAPPFPVTERRKFNPLQKTSYFFTMFLFVPLMVITGIALLFPEVIIEKVFTFNGILLTAMLHAVLGFILSIFLLVHIYVCTVGRDPLSNFKSIVDGWHEVHHDTD